MDVGQEERGASDMKGEIIGTGDIASVLEVKDGIRYFVSGVSNSREDRESEYDRERELLQSQDKDLRLVYVSSISVFDGESRYYKHKREMEDIVKTFPKYCIVRIGNISWGTNPNTIINYLKNRVDQQEPIQIQDVFRYVVNEEEFLYWVEMIPNFNCEMSIPGLRMKVREIVKQYVL